MSKWWSHHNLFTIKWFFRYWRLNWWTLNMKRLFSFSPINMFKFKNHFANQGWLRRIGESLFFDTTRWKFMSRLIHQTVSKNSIIILTNSRDAELPIDRWLFVEGRLRTSSQKPSSKSSSSVSPSCPVKNKHELRKCKLTLAEMAFFAKQKVIYFRYFVFETFYETFWL